MTLPALYGQPQDPDGDGDAVEASRRRSLWSTTAATTERGRDRTHFGGDTMSSIGRHLG